MYIDAAVVEVKKNILLFRCALAILCCDNLTYKTRKSNDNLMSHFGFFEGIKMANLIKNILFRKCPHTSHCIRREFFCDGRVNCAWPNAEEGGTDEINCDAEGKGNFNFRT